MKKTDAVATRCATGPWSCSASHSAGAVQSSRRVDLEHIEWRPDGLLINIPYSKTNESGEPEVIGVPKFVGDPLCPVAALAAWVHYAKITAGAVFVTLSPVAEQRR